MILLWLITDLLITNVISVKNQNIEKSKQTRLLEYEFKNLNEIEKKWSLTTKMDYKKDAIYTYWVQYTTKVNIRIIFTQRFEIVK